MNTQAWQSERLDAWDGLLRLIAFFAVEINVPDGADRGRNGYAST